MKRFILLFCYFLTFNLGFAHPNYEDFVLPVYQELCAAKGDFSQQLPNLEISDRIFNIAAYSRKANQLIVEEKAIEICQSFQGQSKTALAFLLGHELTHFYQSHDGGFSFLLDKTKFEQKFLAEREADINGAMLAYYAGYEDVVDIMPKLIDKLYDNYGLDNQKMVNYPSKDKRKALIDETVELVKKS